MKAEPDILAAIAAAPKALGRFPGLELLDTHDAATEAELERLQQAYVEDIENGQHTAERVAALRQWMQAQAVDALIVPLHDIFFGEYVPLANQRLAWLTGFTGSNGQAVIMQEKAAFFSDGRYTLQMQQQVDQRIFELRHIIEAPLEDWLRVHLQAGQTLACDASLHTQAQVDRWQTLADGNKARLRLLEENPVDAVWHERPPMPLSPVRLQPLEWAGLEARDKVSQIAGRIRQAGASHLLLTQSDSIAWLLNVRGMDVPNTPFVLSFLVLNAEGEAHWFVDARKLHTLNLPDFVHLHAPETLPAFLQELKDARVAVAPQTCPVGLRQAIERSGGHVLEMDDPCQLPKAVKNAAELAGMRQAHVIDAVAMCRFLHWFDQLPRDSRPTEMDLAEQLEQFRRQSTELVSLSFDSISGAGPNGAIVHYRVTPQSNRALEQDEIYLIDSGGQYVQGTTDITRTLIFGQPTAEMKDRFTRVLKGHILLGSSLFPAGTSGAQLDTLARHALWQAGLDYDHGTGHGVGAFLSVHEGPQSIGKGRSPVPLQPGMVLSNEPGYYKTGGYGIRIENLVEVVEKTVPGAERPLLGFENLTLVPIDRHLIEPGLLSETERRWLDAYHARVRETIGPLLEEPVRQWLQQATAPLELTS